MEASLRNYKLISARLRNLHRKRILSDVFKCITFFYLFLSMVAVHGAFSEYVEGIHYFIYLTSVPGIFHAMNRCEPYRKECSLKILELKQAVSKEADVLVREYNLLIHGLSPIKDEVLVERLASQVKSIGFKDFEHSAYWDWDVYLTEKARRDQALAKSS